MKNLSFTSLIQNEGFMKKLILPLLLLIFFTGACSKDDDVAEPQENTENIDPAEIEVERFIYRAMDDWYLYEAEVPELGEGYFSSLEKRNEYLASFDTPQALFDDLQASHDRFSFMWNDYEELEKLLYSGIEKSTGMVYGLGRINGTDDVFGIVYYVLPGTSAEERGVLRGDAFKEINGQKLTVSNYRSLLGMDSYTLTIADIEGGKITNTDRKVELVNQELAENPVYMTSVFEIEGQKIGYLLYNGFTMDFDPKLNEAFGNLKAEAIDHLILDLRYNSGGSVGTAIDLASMITGQFNGELLAQTMLNEKWQKIYEKEAPEALEYRFNSTIHTGEAINSLNLDQVYVIATKKSASASELLINGLNAYIDVVHVGENTAGKFQGSRTLYDSNNMFFSKKDVNPNHKYAVQPLITKFANAHGVTDFVNGLQPDIEASENINDYGPLGDPSEILVNTAVNHILGYKQAQDSKMKTYQDDFTIFGGSDMFKPTYQRMYINEFPVVENDLLLQ